MIKDYIYRQNHEIEISRYTLKSTKLLVDSYRIIHLSDSHNQDFDKYNPDLYQILSNLKPNIILISGDVIDSRNLNYDLALNFLKNLSLICDVYYVSGNHESRILDIELFFNKMKEIGIVILKNESINLDNGINIFGLDDVSFYLDEDKEKFHASWIEEKLNEYFVDQNLYNILLTHRPERFDSYVKFNYDLVLTGHAHGGQFRLPYIGGLFAPNQGIFPKYSAGLYTKNNTNMINNRGIGPSRFPLRLNNKPEIIVIDFES